MTRSIADAIAVVGVSALFPGSVGAQSFWQNIVAGRDFMTDVPADHWLVEDYFDSDPAKPGKIYAKRGAFLPAVDFDPLEHGLPPRQLSTTDTAQLLALIVAQKVLDDAASVQFGKVDRRDISVILGVASATELVGQMAARIQRPHWVEGLRNAGFPEDQLQAACDRIEATYPTWDESTFPGLLGNVVAGRIANRLDLGGMNCVVDAACASSLGAVAMAVQELRLGHSSLVITGGVDALNDVFMYMCFSKTPALSPTGDCRPFAEDADGTMLGEGIGMVALRRLVDAERDGDSIYAVLRGVGASSDGRAKSIYAPRSEGQEIAIHRAYEGLDFGPADVGLIEAHGTATTAGDLAEFGGLQRAFAEVPGRQVCALGSIKSQIGHTKAAAGSASLFKTVMALHHKVLPPTIKVDRPNGKLDLANSPFYLNTRTRPWIAPASGAPRRAGVSSFGFGGSNFHVALEEYRGTAGKRVSTMTTHLVLLGGDTPEALLADLAGTAQALADRPVSTIARESQLAFDAGRAHRVAILGADAATVGGNIEAAVGLIGKAPGVAVSLPNRLHYGIGPRTGRIAFLFPGQGSQYLDMGADLAIEFDVARSIWDEAAVLPMGDGPALHDVVHPIPVFEEWERQAQAARLVRTEWAQPAIGATSASMLRLLDTLGLRPDAVAGHSYGEVTALYAAGVIGSLADLLAVSRRRGELMAEAAAGDGAMLAVRAEAAAVQALLDSHRITDVTLANRNSPSQTVVGGRSIAVEAFQPVAEAAGLACRRLTVATAFHTSLVAGSVAPFARFLEGVPFAAPALPVYGNSQAAAYPDRPEAIRETLAGQLAKPVQFADMVDRLYVDGVRTFVEVGPGATLRALVDECLGAQAHLAVAIDGAKADGRAAFLNALGQLGAHGIALNFAALWRDFAVPEDDAGKSTRSPATVKLNGTNYGKPYPPANGAAGRAPARAAQPIAPPTAVAPASAHAHKETMMSARPPSAPAPVAPDAAWTAFQAMQANMLEAQKAFTQALSDSHQAFLRASEASMLQLAGRTAAPLPTETLATGPAPAVEASAPAIAPPVMPMTVPAAPPPRPAATMPAPRAPDLTLVEEAKPSATAADATELLLTVVAEKTGYPVEMLTLDMELEAGLGIDSIKRVQILSALQEKLPQLADVDTAALAALDTLGAIVALAGMTDLPAAAPAAANVDVVALLLAVVAEKTGYPAEMLTLDMELEAGLGIDSIKRVQILSALQEKLPQLADVDTAALAALDTLGAIVALAGSGGIVASSSPSSAAPASLTPTLGRMIVAEEESAVPGLLTPGFAGVQSIWIIGGPADLAGMLAARLAETGLHARAVDTPPVDVRAAILLAGIAETSDADPIATTETVFRQVQACGHAMAAGGTLVIVQPGGEADAGWLAGAGAIAKTAALEWPNVVVRVIELSADVLAGESSAEAIHRELIGGGMQLEVTLAGDGRRLVPALRPEPAPTPATVAIPTDGVLLVSGGARGITAACLTELLAERPQKVAILGRTPLEDEPAELAGIVDDAALKRALLGRHQAAGITPSPQRIGAEVRAILAARELRTNLARLAATGATVRYDAVDIADADAALEAVARIRSEFGPISGLVHAAGVLADKEILLKTSDQFRTVMRTKVDGLRNLLDATRDDALTRLVCFSSIAAWRGNLGQSDYAAANQVLNRVCRAERKRRGEACLVKSIGWGPWAGGMVDAGLEALFVARGVPLIPLKEGARFFADEYLGRNGSAVEVVFGGGLAAFAAADLPRSRSFHARFHRSTHGYIDSHVVRSNRVVPMVAAIEVALRSVAHWLGGVARRAVDLEVVNGMVLSSFEGAGDVFEIGCTAPDGEGRVAVTITDPAGKLCYRMGIVPGEAPLANSEAERPSLDRWPAAKPIYDGRLFHGPALQVIETIEGLDEHGAAGLLRTRVPLAASASSAPIDILDGGIQLSTLWNHETRGRESLPTSAAAVYLAEGWDHAAPVRCEALLIAKTSLSSRWTLRYRDEAGTLLGLIEGLTMHDLPAAAA